MNWFDLSVKIAAAIFVVGFLILFIGAAVFLYFKYGVDALLIYLVGILIGMILGSR